MNHNESNPNEETEFPKRSREELMKIIQQSSRSEFILDEMQRYGFWPDDEGEPTLQEEMIRKETSLQKDLNELLRKQRQQKNHKFMLRKMRKERMAEAKKRRKETKAKRAAAKKQRAEEWKRKQEADIVYLGEDVSYGLHLKEGDKQKLSTFGLPHFETIEALAKAMQLTIGKLRWLTFNRKVSTTSHYKRFEIPKNNKEVRVISAPMYLLKTAQYWVLENILYKIKIEEEAHGFVPSKSILSNAKVHVAQSLVVNMDMRNFFPTITYKRVKGMFSKLGYAEQVATVLALLCTEPETDKVRMDEVDYYVQTGNRYLPQGAPTSPAITNILCRRLDRRLAGVAAKLGFRYSRYADDLTFSALDTPQDKVIGRLLWQTKMIVKEEGFELHPKKLQVMRQGAKREVTGIVVNEKPNIARKKMRQFKAVLHQIEENGPKGKTWGKGDNLFLSLQSFASYVAMVNPQKGKIFAAQVQRIRRKYDSDFLNISFEKKKKTTDSKNEKKKSWWDKFLGK